MTLFQKQLKLPWCSLLCRQKRSYISMATLRRVPNTSIGTMTRVPINYIATMTRGPSNSIATMRRIPNNGFINKPPPTQFTVSFFSTTSRKYTPNDTDKSTKWRDKPWLMTTPFEKEVFFSLYRRNIDVNFTEAVFLSGAKIAVERVSEALSQGRLDECMPLMEADELDRVAKRVAKLDDVTRQWLRIDTRDLLVCKLNIYGFHEGPMIPFQPGGEAHAHLTVSMAGYHGAQKLPEGKKMAPKPVLADTFMWRATFRQRTRPNPDESTPWSISKITCARNPFGYQPQFFLMKQCAKLRLTVL